jgi:ATP-dependent DNA helicase RecQ
VQIITVPQDPIAQAAAVMKELQRLHSLDPSGDWSDFALLARNHATLEPLCAASELAGIRHSSPGREQAGQPRLHQVREGRALLVLLDGKPQRRLRAAAISRWTSLRFPDPKGDNPWAGLLAQFADELEAAWPDLALPGSIVKEALFEFGSEARRSERGRIVLSTVHGAKGREFRHVVLLDGGDWHGDSEEERRLYYVGMTRARETLTLCEAASNPNPFSPRLPDAPYVVRSALARDLESRPELRWRYMTLGLRDVDLGFAGRQVAGSPAHAALEELATGDPLVLESVRPGAHVLGRQAVPVGRLSNSCRLPAGRIIRASVGGLVWRTREQALARRLDRHERTGASDVAATITFEDIGDLLHALSPARLELIRMVKNEPGSITGLAQRLNRDRSAVTRDVELLRQLGILEVEDRPEPGHHRQKWVSPRAPVMKLEALV